MLFNGAADGITLYLREIIFGAAILLVCYSALAHGYMYSNVMEHPSLSLYIEGKLDTGS